MAIVKSVTVNHEKPWSGGRVKRRYQVILTDNQLTDHSTILMPEKVLPTDVGIIQAARLLQAKKDLELAPDDKVIIWNDSQADYDRRALGRAMLLTDVHEFRAYLDLFKAMEIRSGNNAGQRAATLGVNRADYDLMAKRFNDLEGALFFIDNEKNQIWHKLPADFD